MRFASLALIALLLPAAARAQNPPELPYSQRTRGYMGWSTTVRGDIGQIGMAGAMVGIADSFIASADNPAGLAMTFGGISLTTNFNRVQDQDIQSYQSPGAIANIGTAATRYPWGFSAGWWTTADEGRPYLAQGSSTVIDPRVRMRELRASAARLFFRNRLSLGASLFLADAEQSLRFPESPGQNVAASDQSAGLTLGALWQADPERRIFLGASYTPALTIDFAGSPATTSGITDFHQPVRSPWRLAFGVGWIPSRFFRAGAALYGFGPTPRTSLLADQSVDVAVARSWQPRLGARYRFADLKLLRASAAAGTYLEPNRIEGQPARLHGTVGLDLEFWVIDLGFALDRADGYSNSIFSVGLDILRTLETLELVPRRPRASRVGWFPQPLAYDAAELPRPINPTWRRAHEMDLLEIGRQLPDRMERKLEEIGEAISEPFVSPAPRPRGQPWAPGRAPKTNGAASPAPGTRPLKQPPPR